MGTDN